MNLNMILLRNALMMQLKNYLILKQMNKNVKMLNSNSKKNKLNNWKQNAKLILIVKMKMLENKMYKFAETMIFVIQIIS